MLHPESRAFLAEREGGDDTTIEQERELARAEALAQADAVREQWPVALVRDVDAGGVGARLYRPAEGARVLLYVHGGGWVFHDLETHDAFCRYLARETGWAVFAVDYRLAPEHPYPAPLDDVETAGRWLGAHAGELGVDASVLPALGDSSGGNLVAGLAVRDPHLLAHQILVYPALDKQASSASLGAEDNAALTREGMVWFWNLYAGDLDNDEISPLRRAEVVDLPPAHVLTAEHDGLRDEGEAYAARLMEAGVPVTATRALGMVHGFWRFPERFAASRQAVAEVARVLADLA